MKFPYDSDDGHRDPKPDGSHDLARQPSCNEADHQYDKEINIAQTRLGMRARRVQHQSSFCCAKLLERNRMIK